MSSTINRSRSFIFPLRFLRFFNFAFFAWNKVSQTEWNFKILFSLHLSQLEQTPLTLFF